MDSKRFSIATVEIDGNDVRIKYADLLVARHDNSVALDWECVLMPFATTTMEQGAYRVAVITIGTILSSFILIQTPKMNRLLHLHALHRDDWVLVGLAGLFFGCLLFLRDFFVSRIRPTTA